MRRNGRVRNKWNAAAPRREGLGEKEETRMRCMRKTAVSPRKWNARSGGEGGGWDGARQQAGGQEGICMAERAENEGGREGAY